MMMGKLGGRSLLCVLFVAIAGCESLPESTEDMLPDTKVEYKSARQGDADLEVPPDLTRSATQDPLAVPEIAPSATASYSQYSADRGSRSSVAPATGVLPSPASIEFKKDRDKRWLVIDEPPAEVWPRVVAFWRENGILLVQEDPSVGIMETGWLENRADIKSDIITDTVRGFFDGLYTAAVRDQYRVRIEAGGSADKTELFLTHRGMQQNIARSPDGTERPVWEPRPNDPELEAEMLRRIAVYLGVDEQRAATMLARKQSHAPMAQLIKDRDGRAALMIEEELDRAWRLTGVALDRVGFVVEDRDRSKGIYYVRYRDPMEDSEGKSEGLLSKLAFWSDSDKKSKDKEYQIHLMGEQQRTRVVVLNEQGQPDETGTAVRILTLLDEQIR